MIDFVAVGNNIATNRKALGLTQEELAGSLFVTRQLVSKWENGTGAPSIDDIIALSKLFAIPIEELLCLDQDIDIDEADIFKGHSRMFVVRSLISGKITIDICANFYRFSPAERMMLLNAVKKGELSIDISKLFGILSPSEQNFMTSEVK